MRFFKRGKSDPQSVPVTEQTYISNQPQGSKIDWKRAIPRILAALLLIAAVVFLVIWVAGALSDEDPKPKEAEKKPAIAKDDSRNAEDKREAEARRATDADNEAASSERSRTAATTLPGDDASSETARTDQRTPAGAAIANSGRLADTGPTETIAAFVIATATGVIAYQTMLRRRLN